MVCFSSVADGKVFHAKSLIHAKSNISFAPSFVLDSTLTVSEINPSSFVDDQTPVKYLSHEM